MIEYWSDWDEFSRGAWESFERKAFEIAAALKLDRSSIAYSDIAKAIDAYWEIWLNGSNERRKIFEKAKEGLPLKIFQSFQSSSAVSIPPLEPESWVTEVDKQRRYYWPLTKEVMTKDMGIDVTEAIDSQSEIVLRHLQDPRKAKKWLVRGLVVGSIQAGKTANYSALISKAADAGYRLIIVLAGVHNDLRSQTQRRLDHDFVGFSRKNKTSPWPVGVGKLKDFDPSRQPQAATDLDQDFGEKHMKMEERPWLVVMKKEQNRLKKFNSWFKNQRRNAPVLIIDDEADQASINTAVKLNDDDRLDDFDWQNDEREEASRINSLIRQIIKNAQCCSYVGYTASPFANLFIDASADSQQLGQDLFPEDFIVTIPTPANYFGPKEYFDPDSQEESALFVPFPLSEASKWIDNKYEVGSIPATAKKCILQFIVSASIKAWRAARRTKGLSSENPEESSMLVHVSHLVDVQQKIAEQFSEQCRLIRSSILLEGVDTTIGNQLKALFAEQRSITETIRKARDGVDRKRDWSLPGAFDDLWLWIEKIVSALAVIVVNGESEPYQKGLLQREQDADKFLKPLIWIGGNKLSRGLTIPALCMSVYLRAAGAADALLQMGRWFGYRDGYSDLCRISTTLRLADRFMKVSCTLDDLGEQIGAMNNLVRSPKDYRLIVQQHPGFLLTSTNKMRTAEETSVCFAGYHTEMRRFVLADAVPQENFRIAERLVNDAHEFGQLVYDSDYTAGNMESQPNWLVENSHPSGCLWRYVPADCVIDFFAAYLSPEGSGEDNGDIARIIRFIKKENEAGRLLKWNLWLGVGREIWT